MTFTTSLRHACFATLLLFFVGKQAEAATVTLSVNSTADSDMAGFCTNGATCTIRTSFRLADASPADIFNVDIPANTYTISGGHLSLTAGRINLRGQGFAPSSTILRRDSNGGRLIQVNTTGTTTPVLTLFNLTMRDADVTNDNLQGSGSAVNSFSGSITADRVFFFNNKNFFLGGAVLAQGGSVFITRSRFVGNQLAGGGGCAGGLTAVGGAVFARANGSTPANLSIHQTEFTGNVSNCRGGAIGVDGGGNFFLVNSVVSGNSALAQGGGVEVMSTNPTPTKAFLRLSTIVNNSVITAAEGISGGGLAIRGTTTSPTPEIRSAFGMLIGSNAGPGDNADCGVVATVPTAPTDMQGNVVGKIGNCATFLGTPSANATRIGTTSAPVNPLVGTLTTLVTNYTFTMSGHIPQTGSPARGFQFNSSALGVCGDQRQFNRPQCLSRIMDIGSIEVNGTP